MKSGILKLFLAIVMATASAWFAWRMVAGTTVRFGAVAVTETSGTARLAMGYGMTLVGVFLGSAYRYLEAQRKAGATKISSIRRFLGAVFRSIDFWIGICGSPLVYALLLRATEGGSNAGLTAIAIENGFFCTMVLGQIKQENLATSKSKASALSRGESKKI